jgi:hypothetical protein
MEASVPLVYVVEFGVAKLSANTVASVGEQGGPHVFVLGLHTCSLGQWLESRHATQVDAVPLGRQ